MAQEHRIKHANILHFMVGIAAALTVVTKSYRANAAFSWATCSSVTVPTSFGANETDRLWGDASQYGMNEYQTVRLLVNGNVSTVEFHYTNFNSELNYDWLSIWDAGAGENRLMGNLGSGTTNWLWPRNYPNNPNFDWDWVSDSSITRVSVPKIDSAQVSCHTPQTTHPHYDLSLNVRHEALLIGTGDVIYTSAWQPANTVLRITADLLAATSSFPDVDVYASTTTTMPDDSNYTWRAYNGSSGGLAGSSEELTIPSSASSRWIYIGARAYSSAMHFALRANVQRASGGNRTIVICHPGVPNIQQHANWLGILNTLQKTSARIFTATHGNIFMNFAMKYADGNGGGNFCEGISGCDGCMTHIDWEDSCGVQSYAPGTFRIPNAACSSYDSSDLVSYLIAHEVSHGQFGLPDEYSGPNGIGHCAHSIMNGPQNGSYRYCLQKDHCRGGGTYAPSSFDCTATGNMWKLIGTGPAASWFYSFPTQGLSEPTGQIWASGWTNPRTQLDVAFTFQ